MASYPVDQFGEELVSAMEEAERMQEDIENLNFAYRQYKDDERKDNEDQIMYKKERIKRELAYHAERAKVFYERLKVIEALMLDCSNRSLFRRKNRKSGKWDEFALSQSARLVMYRSLRQIRLLAMLAYFLFEAFRDYIYGLSIAVEKSDDNSVDMTIDTESLIKDAMHRPAITSPSPSTPPLLLPDFDSKDNDGGHEP